MPDLTLLLAQRALQTNRDKVQNAPWAQTAINAIMSGDATTGSQLAANLCNSMGMTQEEAIQQIRSSLNLPF